MANSASHAALPYPIKGARYTVFAPYLDADGDPTDGTSLDSEVSKDNGAFADAAEEVTLASGSRGMGILTLSGAETDCSTLAVWLGAATAKATLLALTPAVLAEVGTGTLSAGSAGGGTLGTLLSYDVTGCFIKTTGGTGGGGTGGANNQVRKIATYNTGSGAFTVVPNWETTPSTDTTYAVLLPEGVTLGMLKTLNPTTAGRTLDVSAGGEAGIDWANIGSPTTAQNLSGTNIDTDQVVASVTGAVGSVTGAVGSVTGLTPATVHADLDDIQARLPAALVAGRIDASVGAMAADVVTAAAMAADAVTEIQSGLSTAAELAKVPRSDSNVTWNATAAAQLQSEAADALNAYDPPTKAELDAAVAPLATAANLATVAAYIDTEVASILAAVDTEVGDIRTRVLLALPDAAANDPAGGLPVLNTVNYGGGDIVTILSGVDGAVWEKHEVLSAHNEGSTGKELYDQIATLATAAALAAAKTILDKLDTMLEAGTNPNSKFTIEALENAPAGGGGGGTDWNANERTAIRTILGIPGSGTTPADPTDGVLYDIKIKTDLIGTGDATVVSPVNETGDVITIVPGNAYTVAGGNAITFTIDGGAVPDLSGVTVTLGIATALDEGDGTAPFEVTGTVVTGHATNPQVVRFTATAAETEDLRAYFGVKMTFDVIAAYAGGVSTRSIVRGECKVLKQI